MELMPPNNNGRQGNRPAGFRISEPDEPYSRLIQDERKRATLTILIPGYFFLLFGFFTSFFAPCLDCAMCHHLFRLIVSIACRCFRSNAAALAATVAAILSLPLPAVEAEPGPLRASRCFFPVCAAFFPRSSFALLFLSAAFEN
jgi:hypothetical protein